MLLCRFLGYGLLIFSVLTSVANADECSPSAATGSYCELSIDQIRPTQFSVGEVAVACKASKISGKSKNKLKDYLENKKRLVPIVVGPDGQFYMTDHHHLVKALFKASNSHWDKDSKLLHVEIIDNYSGQTMSQQQFWDLMQNNHRSYLVDNKGTQNMNFELMPKHVSELSNDPYRTLSRWVRESCGFVKAGQDQCDSIRTSHAHAAPYFMEFYWGDFFRKNLPLQVAAGESCQSQPYSKKCLTNEIPQLKSLYEQAMQLAVSDAAKSYFESLQLDPWAYGYNPTGERIELNWFGYGKSCEEPVND